MSDYEIVDEEQIILFAPIDKPKDADTQAAEEFWSDECWKTPE